MRKTIRSLFSILFACILGTTVFLTAAWISPPEPLPVEAPAVEFSAGRAMQHLYVITREPHPMGISDGHADVRDYIWGEIRDLGLEVQLQDEFGINVFSPGFLAGGPVENILARLPGIDPDGAILVMAHYDSAPNGPGAADNGSGVVTLLELVRALQAGPPLQQDLIFLFTDGEEPGMLGAQAFVDQHPWFDQVSMVINLDQLRAGPLQFREIRGGNGTWIRALTCDVRLTRPGFVSFPFDIAPSSATDLLPFTAAGIRGVNLQTTSPATEVHTTLDLPAIVDPGSIQQAGDQLLGLVRCLGDQQTLGLVTPDQVYFPALGNLVHYPVSWATYLTILAGACFLGTLFYGLYSRKLTCKGLGLGCAAFLLGLVFSVFLTALIWLGIQGLHPAYAYDLSLGRMTLSSDNLYTYGFFSLVMAITAISINLVRRKISFLDLAAGALVFWFPLAMAATIKLPASSYVFTWILFCGSLALLLALLSRDGKNARTLIGMGFLASAIWATVLWIPWISIGVYSGALGGGITFMSLMMLFAALWIGSLIPLLDWIMEPKRLILPATAAFVALGFLIAGHFLVGRDSPPPLANSIGYWFDADDNQAVWIAFVGGSRTDARTLTQNQTQFPDELDARQTSLLVNPVRNLYTDIFPEAPPFSVLTSTAPVLEVDGPRMEVLADNRMNDLRIIEIRFTTSLHDRLYIFLPDAPLLAITVPDENRIELPASNGWVLRFDGMPNEAIQIRFELFETGILQFLLVEESTGLPLFPGLATQPVPGTMQLPGEFTQGIATDFTAVSRIYSLPASAP
jgi:hypothetical protein